MGKRSYSEVQTAEARRRTRLTDERRPMTKRQMVAHDAEHMITGAKKIARPVPAKETQEELLRGAAQSLRDYADTYDSAQPWLERQIEMCEKAADDVARLADALHKMATP